jgi:hypothetical protein
MNLPIIDGDFNKNYRLPLERLYGRRILENHEEEEVHIFSKSCRSQAEFETFTYLFTIEAGFRNRRFSFERDHPLLLELMFCMWYKEFCRDQTSHPRRNGMETKEGITFGAR